MVYLDNAATTRMHQDVLAEMIPYMRDKFGNAGSLHRLGGEAADAVNKARMQVANLIGAKANQIIFTSGGSESNNMVFKCTADYLKAIGKTKILVSAIEHDSVIKASEALKHDGFTVELIPVDSNGMIDGRKLLDEWTDDVGILSVMLENNEIGSVNDVELFGTIARAKGVLFHTDCVQAAGWQPIDVESIGCDFLSLSSHKIHGPKGMGALYVRGDKEILRPLIHGGDFQEFGYRGGTENVPGIVGFGKACEIARESLPRRYNIYENVRGAFMACLFNRLDGGWYENNTLFHSKNISLRFDGVDAETLLMMLNANNVYVSAGSACRSREIKPSRVLKAIGLSDEQAMNTIRVSFSIDTTEAEAEFAAEKIAECVKAIRRMKKGR